MSTVDLSEKDNKETLFVKEEVTNDAEVFGEVEVDVEGLQTEPLLSMLLPPGSSVLPLLSMLLPPGSSVLPPGSSIALRAPAGC